MHDCVCSIVPPHILHEIVKNGNAAQRRGAKHSIQAAVALRTKRTLWSPPTKQSLVPQGPPMKLIYSADGSTTLPGTIGAARG
jgi:hypothetical protein